MLHPSLVVLRLILKCSVGSSRRSSAIIMLSGAVVVALLSMTVTGGDVDNAVKSAGAEGEQSSYSVAMSQLIKA